MRASPSESVVKTWSLSSSPSLSGSWFQISPLKASTRPRPQPVSGWMPVSPVILSLEWPRPRSPLRASTASSATSPARSTARPTANPAPSGPRCRVWSSIVFSNGHTSAPLLLTKPTIEHISTRFHDVFDSFVYTLVSHRPVQNHPDNRSRHHLEVLEFAFVVFELADTDLANTCTTLYRVDEQPQVYTHVLL